MQPWPQHMQISQIARPPNFYRGSKSAKFGLDSQYQSPLTGSNFETEQHIANLKHVSVAQMIALNTEFGQPLP